MNYEVYAIKYASRHKRSQQNFYGNLDPHENSSMPINFYIWLAVSEKHKVIIDSGFSEKSAKERGREFSACPVHSLEKMGVGTDDVSHLIVTHFHWDHIGNSHKFMNAQIILQEEEMAFWTGRYASKPGYRHLVQSEDVLHFVEENFKGRIRFVDGTEEILPGLTVHKVGGHSAGLQVVQIQTKKGNVVLASDAAHYYDNIERNYPFSVVHNLAEMHAAFEKIKTLTKDERLIVPGHDPLVMKKFEPPFKELADVVVQIK